MNNKNESFFLNFGNVAYPFTVEDALEGGGASYRKDEIVEQTKITISEIRNFMTKFQPLISPVSADGSQDDEGLIEALKLLLDARKAKQPSLS